MLRLFVAHRRQSEEAQDNPAWPALVDLFAFGMVVMLLLWVQALPEPPKPPPPKPDPAIVDLQKLQGELQERGLHPDEDFEFDRRARILRFVRLGHEEVFFPSGVSDLTVSDIEAIRTTAKTLSSILGKFPQLVVVVNGTADPNPLSRDAPPRDNVELSALRAAAVSKILVEEGLKGRFQIVGLGEIGTAVGKTSEEMKQYRKVFLEIRWRPEADTRAL